MDVTDIAEAASKLSRAKVGPEVRRASVMIENDLDHQQCAWAAAASVATLTPEVVRLIIAARRAFDLGYNDEEFGELDKALEAFSERVPYDDEGG